MQLRKEHTLDSAAMHSEEMEPLTIAVLGAGNMGVCLARALSRVPGVAIKYVYSQTLSRAQTLANQIEAEPVDQINTIFRDGTVDAVVLCLPTYTRLETLRAAVEAGKHIFCEKPLALHEGMSDEISKLFSGYSKTVMVGHVLRFFWEYSRTYDFVQSGQLGQIASVRLSRCVGFPGADSWFAEPAKSGGVVLDLLIHDIDFLRWTFGEVKQVYAKSLTLSQRGVLDYALINVELESGALAHLEGSWGHPIGSFRQSLEICGSKGMLQHDSLTSRNLEWMATAEVKDASTSRVSVPDSNNRNDPYFAEVNHFVDCVREKREPAISVDDALKACKVAFLAMASARQGRPLRIDKAD